MNRLRLLDQLRHGDRRSIGRSDAVARAVLRRPGRLPELAAGLWHPDGLVRMRARARKLLAASAVAAP